MMNGHLPPSSSVVLDWDALSVFLEAVVTRGQHCEKSPISSVAGLGLLQKLLQLAIPVRVEYLCFVDFRLIGSILVIFVALERILKSS